MTVRFNSVRKAVQYLLNRAGITKPIGMGASLPENHLDYGDPRAHTVGKNRPGSFGPIQVVPPCVQTGFRILVVHKPMSTAPTIPNLKMMQENASGLKWNSNLPWMHMEFSTPQSRLWHLRQRLGLDGCPLLFSPFGVCSGSSIP